MSDSCQVSIRVVVIEGNVMPLFLLNSRWLVALQQLLEMEWHEAIEDQDMAAQRRQIGRMACFFLIGYNCDIMRGFELPKGLHTNLRHSICLADKVLHGHDPHVGVLFLSL
jgi:hypothetical protein